MIGDTLLAAASGAAITGGMWLAVLGLVGTRHPPRTPGPPSWWRTRLARVRARWDKPTLVRAGAALVAGLGLWAVTGWLVAGVAVVVGVVALPAVLSGRAAQRRIARIEALEQWSRQLADVLSSGSGLEQTLITTAESAPAPVAVEVRALATRLRLRMPTEEALRAFAEDISDQTGDMIAATLILAAEARGRGLRDVLGDLADVVARDVASRREVEAERATHRTTARWIVAIVACYVAFGVLNRSYTAPFASLGGQVVLACVAGLFAVALWWMHRLATGTPAPRFLANQPASPRLRREHEHEGGS